MRVRRSKGNIVISQTGFEADAIREMKQSGLRITLPRVQVVRILTLADRPLSAYQIHQEIVANGAKVDVVSVYRILETLLKLNLIHHIGLTNGYMACRLEDAHESEAEHIVCSECGKVTELQMPATILQETMSQLVNLGYSLIQARLEVLATCRTCLEKT